MDQTGIKKALNHINDNYVIAVDIETTGLNTDSDNIIEVAAIKFLNGKFRKGPPEAVIKISSI